MKYLHFFHLLIWLAVFAALPKPVTAFFSPSSLQVVNAAAAPFILGLSASLVVHLMVFFKKIGKKRFVFIGGGLVGLIIFGWMFLSRLIVLRNLNNFTLADVDFSQLSQRNIPFTDKSESWQEFLEYVGENDKTGQQDPRWKFRFDLDFSRFHNEVGQYFMDIDELANVHTFKVFNVIGSELALKNSLPGRELMIQVYENFEDEERLLEVMDSFGIQKDQKVLLYCERGISSATLTYILRNYGFDVYFAALYNLDDFSLLEDENKKLVKSSSMIIDLFENDPQSNYVYLLINANDQFIFGDKQVNEEVVASFEGRLDLINVQDDKDHLFALWDWGMLDRVVSYQDFNWTEINEKKVMCLNKFHCYLTRHYLLENEVHDVKKLYCYDCLNN